MERRDIQTITRLSCYDRHTSWQGYVEVARGRANAASPGIEAAAQAAVDRLNRMVRSTCCHRRHRGCSSHRTGRFPNLKELFPKRPRRLLRFCTHAISLRPDGPRLTFPVHLLYH